MNGCKMYNPALKQEFIDYYRTEIMASWKHSDRASENLWIERTFSEICGPVEYKYDTDVSMFKFDSQCEEVIRLMPDSPHQLNIILAFIRAYVTWCREGKKIIRLVDSKANPLMRSIIWAGFIQLKGIITNDYIRDSFYLRDILEYSLPRDSEETVFVKGKCFCYAAYMGIRQNQLVKATMSDLDTKRRYFLGVAIPDEFWPTFQYYSGMTYECREINGVVKQYYYPNGENFVRTTTGNGSGSDATKLARVRSILTQMSVELRDPSDPDIRFSLLYPDIFKSRIFNQVAMLLSDAPSIDYGKMLDSLLNLNGVRMRHDQTRRIEFYRYLKMYYPDLLSKICAQSGNRWHS